MLPWVNTAISNQDASFGCSFQCTYLIEWQHLSAWLYLTVIEKFNLLPIAERSMQPDQIT